ncbi:ATP-binding protein [Rhodobacteraceae bacterium]|nr:ATP-binding protein [Paracoccaceae bacterium]
MTVISTSVNLDTCDQEPIHLIGAVQPHGALIAIDYSTHDISYVSANTQEFVGHAPEELLGKPLAFLIGAQNVAEMPAFPPEMKTPELLTPWFIAFAGHDGQAINAECLPHRNKDHIILEFLQTQAAPATIWEDELLRRELISELIKPDALSELADVSARIIRDVTGFDRVMIYKFAEDKHGEVIAESTNRPDSFLGLHYPASDIPDPARRHFTLNIMRSIPDINGTHIPILGLSGEVADAASAKPLDLTFSKLRAVAPVHVEYLNNMGVGGSLSISLITNGALWGLVACHHYSPRVVSSSRLRFVELLGGTTSALLQSIENTNQLRKNIKAEKMAFFAEQQVRSGIALRDFVATQAAALMDLVDAQGLYMVLGGDIIQHGAVLKPALDFAPLNGMLHEGVATTDHLSGLVQMTAAQMELVAGAAVLSLSEDGQDFMVFSRGNYDQTIRWAGKPEKIERIDEDGVSRLSPRGSFALWQEERIGKSKPFDAVDRDTLRILRRALFALNSVERERIALEAKKNAEAEELRLRHALLDAARSSSLGELASAIAHELNQPLSAITNYVSACQKEIRNAGIDMPPRALELMDTAVSETIRAGELVRRVRDFISRGDLNADYIDLNYAIRQGVGLALVPVEMPHLKVTFDLDESLPIIFADPVQIGQVLLNLSRNSIAAMAGSPRQELTITTIQKEGDVQVIVRDTGPGIPADVQGYIFEPFHVSTTKGMGIGLSLCRSIVEAHSGRIWAEPSDSGAILVFQLPTQVVLDD